MLQHNREKISQPLVLLVDDDASMRRALARTVQLLGYRVESYSSPIAFLDRAETDRASCLIIDLILPEMTGLELQKRLLERGATIATIFLSGNGDIPSTVQAMRDGALDFIEKPVDADTLRDAIEKAVGRTDSDFLARKRSAAARELFNSLTVRQRQVFDGVVAGEPNKVIAHRMGISERTVKAHRHIVMDKMGVRSVADLAFLALDLGRQPTR